MMIWRPGMCGDVYGETYALGGGVLEWVWNGLEWWHNCSGRSGENMVELAGVWTLNNFSSWHLSGIVVARLASPHTQMSLFGSLVLFLFSTHPSSLALPFHAPRWAIRLVWVFLFLSPQPSRSPYLSTHPDEPLWLIWCCLCFWLIWCSF